MGYYDCKYTDVCSEDIRHFLESFYKLPDCGEEEVPVPIFSSYNPARYLNESKHLNEFIIEQQYYTHRHNESSLASIHIKTTHGDYMFIRRSDDDWCSTFVSNGLSDDERANLKHLEVNDFGHFTTLDCMSK